MVGHLDGQTVWSCKIGWTYKVDLPHGADNFMRKSVTAALTNMRDFSMCQCFSGWNSRFSETELAVIEGRTVNHMLLVDSEIKRLVERGLALDVLQEMQIRKLTGELE